MKKPSKRAIDKVYRDYRSGKLDSFDSGLVWDIEREAINFAEAPAGKSKASFIRLVEAVYVMFSPS